uniref:Similar to n=1 Tax=Ascaris lumbricoides TaxID=6252 RepID=A0A0M3HI16_ASCLU
MSAAEAASRHRDIERIEEGGFHSSSFKSTAGGAGGRVKTEDLTDHEVAVEKKQDAHDKAMFGPKWRDPIAKNGEQDDDEDIANIHKEIELANPKSNMFDSKT